MVSRGGYDVEAWDDGFLPGSSCAISDSGLTGSSTLQGGLDVGGAEGSQGTLHGGLDVRGAGGSHGTPQQHGEPGHRSGSGSGGPGAVAGPGPVSGLRAGPMTWKRVGGEGWG